jgi:hypothetical protein
VVIADLELELELDPAEERGRWEEDQAIDSGLRQALDECLNPSIRVRLPGAHEFLTEIELDADALSGLTPGCVENVRRDRHRLLTLQSVRSALDLRFPSGG